MRPRQRFGFATARPLALLALAFAGGAARADNFQLRGVAVFTNVQQGTQAGALVPYLGEGQSRLIGPNIQTGTIKNLTGLMPVDATTFTFKGEVGPHPLLPGNPKVHVITTCDGNILCTWTAVFTLKIVNASGDAVLSGDGAFTVIGGTGLYKNARGTFRTVFQTFPVPAGTDQAVAVVAESGTILR
jgi:hypothetical protein